MIDFELHKNGSETTLKPLTPEAELWIDENLGSQVEYRGGVIVLGDDAHWVAARILADHLQWRAV